MFHRLNRRIPAGIYVAVAGLLLLWLSVKPVSAEPLRLGVYRGVHCALIYLAEEQGFFKKQGLDVVMKEYEAGVLAVDDFIAGKVEIATASDFAFVLQALKHQEVRMPATICMGSDVEFVVRKDRGILQPRDLRGKRVAVVRGGQTEFFLYHYLIFNNIPASSIQVINLKPMEMVKAMADWKIDAAICWPPYTTEMAKRLGANGIRWPAQSGQEYYQVLFAKEAFLKKQTKAMKQFMVALSEAERFMAKYPDRAQFILRQRLKVETEWSRYRFELQLSQDLLVLMEREAKWAIRNNLVEKKEMPNYLDFFYFDALDKVKPQGVSIVH